MFRSKQRKTAGGAARKRKEYADEQDEEATAASGSTGQVDSTGITDDRDDDAEEAAQNDRLARMQRQHQSSKHGKTRVLAFGTAKAAANASRDARANGSNAKTRLGFLTFAEEEDENESESVRRSTARKHKIRPNLSLPRHAEVDADEDESVAANMYSADALAELLREQKIAQRPIPAHEVLPEDRDGGEMDMDVDAEEYQPVIVEDSPPGVEEDEFIPLDAKLMQSRKRKKRVTFGVHDTSPRFAKSIEVQEPSDEEDEGASEQQLEWEEELMRRGGHHQTAAASMQRGGGMAASYPTHKRVPCATVSDIAQSMQRKLERANMERERVSRDIARLQTEAQLVEQQLAQQEDQLLVSSEEFEYFQVIEDFVKGLSFCLREKLPIIESRQRDTDEQRISAASTRATMRVKDIQSELRVCLNEDRAEDADCFGHLPANNHIDSKQSNDTDNAARIERFRTNYSLPSDVSYSDQSVEIFSDAADDFSSLDRVYGRFQEWQAKFPDVYKSAYCDLALVRLFEPYARAELIDWDPLKTCIARPDLKKTWTFEDMKWFSTLRQHQGQLSLQIEEPVTSLLREVVLPRFADAIKSRFDAFSAVHTQSIVVLLDEMARHSAIKHCEQARDELVSHAIAHIQAESKRLVLLAIDDHQAPQSRVRVFAEFLLRQFSALLENMLLLFVTLPKGSTQRKAFEGVMQLLHRLLGFLSHCRQRGKVALVKRAKAFIAQLSGSSFMQSLLVQSTQEQAEFQHLLGLFNSDDAVKPSG